MRRGVAALRWAASDPQLMMAAPAPYGAEKGWVAMQLECGCNRFLEVATALLTMIPTALGAESLRTKSGPLVAN